MNRDRLKEFIVGFILFVFRMFISGVILINLVLGRGGR